ncbi:hypothetical protein [Pseudonocardia acidicola]|uniref:Uncharacterized protein n=1 Tax=Pseudonocardia acidicola TaxID=2724939 RepID=A0ABX1S3L4_9PSEU|nr:hypothetical protein [Pseudonocardia acidicola]NMH96171.1 hypothetical protein [Pseudonocardia acidicola]
MVAPPAPVCRLLAERVPQRRVGAAPVPDRTARRPLGLLSAAMGDLGFVMPAA